jgi:hypothetical protein
VVGCEITGISISGTNLLTILKEVIRLKKYVICWLTIDCVIFAHLEAIWAVPRQEVESVIIRISRSEPLTYSKFSGIIVNISPNLFIRLHKHSIYSYNGYYHWNLDWRIM